MAIVKTINVAVTATTEKFEAGMKRAVVTFDALAIATKVWDATMGNAIALAGKVTDAMNNIDTASKAAASIGIATDELLRLRFAVGEIAGVSADAVDALLTKMIRTIAEGGKPAADSLARMGLSLQQMQAMSPAQAFNTLVDAISQLPGQGAKAAAAVDFFGKSGAALLPVLNSGSAALAESAKFADDFGLSVSSVDASTIETANDTIARMSAVFEGLYNQIAVQVAPQIIAFGQALIFSLQQEGGVKEIATAFQNVGYAVAAAVNVVAELYSALKPVVAVLGNISFGSFFKDMGEQAALTGQGNDFLALYTKNLEAVKAQMADSSISRNAPIGGVDQAKQTALAKEEVAFQKERAEALQRAYAKIAAAQQKTKDAQATRIKDMEEERLAQQKAMDERKRELTQRGQSIKQSVATPIEEFAAKVRELQQLQAGGFIDQETFARAFGEARSGFTDSLKTDAKQIFAAVQGPAAITGGPASNEALSAFRETKRGMDLATRQAEYQKQMAKNLDTMVRRGVILAAAPLGRQT